MCCCDNRSETLGLLDPIYAGSGISNPAGTILDYWDWSDPPPRHDGGGSIGNMGTPLPGIVQTIAAPAAAVNTPTAAAITAPAPEGVDTTTILIVLGILGAVFMATR